MIITRPNVEPNGLYNQKQAAEELKINRHTLARYEADGLIKFHIRKAGKRKITTGAQIVKCWEAVYL